MSVKVYGIRNCNTVKSALTWLKDNKIDFDFHDFKSEGITPSKLKTWCVEVGWENLLNRRGTTWRQLSPAVKEKIRNQSAAIALMQEKTSVIKRPVVESGDKIVTLGFDNDTFRSALRAAIKYKA